MVTDGILCAVQGMTDRFDTTEAKNAGNAIFEMLADFDEGMWEKLTNSYAVDAWLSQHIKKAFISNPLRERFTIDNKKEVGCMCDVAERLERKGIEKGLVEGRAEGQNLLVAVVNRLRNGETAEQIIASGVDAQTVALAQSIK